jgi:hypothetical protein
MSDEQQMDRQRTVHYRITTYVPSKMEKVDRAIRKEMRAKNIRDQELDSKNDKRKKGVTTTSRSAAA